MMKWLLAFVIALALVSIGLIFYYQWPKVMDNEPTACTAEAKICPDGTAVGRTGPNCEFAECPRPNSVDDMQAHIDSKAGRIQLESPEPLAVIESPLTIRGQARGVWYFEATFPIVLADWDGLIIAEGYATAEGDPTSDGSERASWMTEEFVPFSATLEFEKPEFGNRGTLILQKANPSGLSEHDDALEVPIFFEEEELIAI